MKRMLVPCMMLAVALPAFARDTIVNIPLADVVAMGEAQSKLDGSVRFYLADAAGAPKVVKRMDSDVSNLKTNALNKTDLEACKWVALSVLVAFQNSAKARGANAVVDLVSYYKKRETKSPTTVECHAGATVAGLALKGTYAVVE